MTGGKSGSRSTDPALMRSITTLAASDYVQARGRDSPFDLWSRPTGETVESAVRGLGFGARSLSTN
jgi:hypothetical protein